MNPSTERSEVPLTNLIRKVIVHWNNTPALNAVNVWYTFDSGGNWLPDLRTWYNSFSSYIPSGITITFPTVGEVLDDSDGSVANTWSESAVSTVTGTAGGAYASGTGACFVWNTGIFLTRRQLRGRTFMVPLAGMVDTDGSLSTGFASAVNTSTATFLAATVGKLSVWHRPVGFAGGTARLVDGYSLHDRPAFLNSRRR